MGGRGEWRGVEGRGVWEGEAEGRNIEGEGGKT